MSFWGPPRVKTIYTYNNITAIMWIIMTWIRVTHIYFSCARSRDRRWHLAWQGRERVEYRVDEHRHHYLCRTCTEKLFSPCCPRELADFYEIGCYRGWIIMRVLYTPIGILTMCQSVKGSIKIKKEPSLLTLSLDMTRIPKRFSLFVPYI